MKNLFNLQFTECAKQLEMSNLEVEILSIFYPDQKIGWTTFLIYMSCVCSVAALLVDCTDFNVHVQCRL